MLIKPGFSSPTTRNNHSPWQKLATPFLSLILIMVVATGCPDDGGSDPDSSTGTDSDTEDTPVSTLCTSNEDRNECCGDGIDNDLDGDTDCQDPQCAGLAGCSGQATAEYSNITCSDGIDNDGDGFIDCMDRDCQESDDRTNFPHRTGVSICTRAEEVFSNTACSDGIDNDEDGDIDCADEDCQGGESNVVCASDGSQTADYGKSRIELQPLIDARCTDGIDNDENVDGTKVFLDCGDFSCSNSWETEVCFGLIEQGNALCADGIDNDKDGRTDCDDPDCADFDENGRIGAIEGTVVCDVDGATCGSNGVTCDGDGVATSLDSAAAQTAAAAVCSDGVDNDNNGFGDCDGISGGSGDFGCTQEPLAECADAENTDALCSDGTDNDGNGFTDCEDFSCSQNPLVTVCKEEESTLAECSDGVENDTGLAPTDRRFVDCFDFTCNPCAIRSAWERDENDELRCRNFFDVNPACRF